MFITQGILRVCKQESSHLVLDAWFSPHAYYVSNHHPNCQSIFGTNTKARMKSGTIKKVENYHPSIGFQICPVRLNIKNLCSRLNL